MEYPSSERAAGYTIRTRIDRTIPFLGMVFLSRERSGEKLVKGKDSGMGCMGFDAR